MIMDKIINNRRFLSWVVQACQPDVRSGVQVTKSPLKRGDLGVCLKTPRLVQACSLKRKGAGQ